MCAVSTFPRHVLARARHLCIGRISHRHHRQGVYMKLQPHNARYAAVGDTKRMLEWVLRRYTAVAAGDTLVINYRGEDHSFNILDVSPGRAIRLIDSDVAVDFAPVSHCFAPLSCCAHVGMRQPLSGEAVPKLNEMDDAEAAADADSDNNNNNTANAKSAAAAAATAPAVAAPGTQLGAVAPPEGVEGKDWHKCANCRRGIPAATYDRHALMCARHNWYCELCGVTVEKRQQDAHIEGTIICWLRIVVHTLTLRDFRATPQRVLRVRRRNGGA